MALRFLFILVICCFRYAPATAQGSNVPQTSQTLHELPIGPAESDTDGRAKAIVNEILFKIIGVTNTNWDIWITDDNRDTANAVARYTPPPKLKREIIFNHQFLSKVSDGAGKWPAYCVAAHEVGHLLRLHLENTDINTPAKLRVAELEADYYCGFVLGKLDGTYDQATSAIRWFSSAPGYPSREERLAQIGRGWTEATGKDFTALATVSVSPRGPAPVNISLQIEAPLNFKQKDNRDIEGHDILSNGRPGIPGISIQACAAQCEKNNACKAFSFDRWNGWCFLKDEITTSRLDPRSTIAVKQQYALPDVSKASAEMQDALKKRFRDDPILKRRVDDFPKCKKACKDEIKCVAFSYLKTAPTGSDNCQMFKLSKGYYFDPESDSGYKEQIQK
jgi:PAN domain